MQRDPKAYNYDTPGGLLSAAINLLSRGNEPEHDLCRGLVERSALDAAGFIETGGGVSARSIPRIKAEGREFFYSEWGKAVCREIGLEARRVLRWVEQTRREVN